MTWTVADLIAQLKRLPSDLPVVDINYQPLEDIYEHTTGAGDRVMVIQFEERDEP